MEDMQISVYKSIDIIKNYVKCTNVSGGLNLLTPKFLFSVLFLFSK